MKSVTVVTPSIPPRAALLERAIHSVMAQTYPAAALSIAIDHEKKGAADTRNRALAGATTPWIAFLDDDDEMKPIHLERLFEKQVETDADVVFPWFDISGGWDPFPMHEHRDWDPADPHTFPITAIVRRDLVLEVGGFPIGPPAGEFCAGEDWGFWLAINALGAKFVHVDERTWIWHHDSDNTSGMPNRW